MKHLKTKKDKIKIIRSVIEGIILLIISVLICRALFTFKEYKPYNINKKSTVTADNNGFIAISYLAVDRDGSSTMISTQRLEEHFDALYKNGYVTITQKDIENYYKHGTPLPRKALFLMFEDGRRDTAIFAEKLMEKYNFKGTMLSYADKFNDKDSKFLLPKDLLKLERTTYWELGSNGYRLSYINVYDRYGRYLGELNSLEYSNLRKYLNRDYNQYLMDYIRDENRIPKESYDEMDERISNDYKFMFDIYKDSLDRVPKLYVLMHSNTGSFANNANVSEINQQWINKLFQMNFNREGYSLNNRGNNIYDLTRMQPQPYWYPNHLLMRIQDDTNSHIKFEVGDLKRKKDWDIIKGASEFRDNVIALTSESEGNGLIRLKNSNDYKNIDLSVRLSGNKLGTQTVYLRADKKLEKYISVKLQNNYLFVMENGKNLYELDLNKLDNIKKQSVDENKLEALKEEYKIYSRGKNILGVEESSMTQPSEYISKKIKTVKEGAKEYIPTIQINEAGNRLMKIRVKNNKLSVWIDNKKAVDGLTITDVSSGYIYLESAWGEFGYSQRNILDDVYDGVFEDLIITDINNQNKILYDNRQKGFDKIETNIKLSWDKIINWFIKTL